MKKHFITGLVILLPVALTLLIVNFFLNLVTIPFAGIIQSSSINAVALKLLAVAIVLTGITLVGFLCSALAFHYIFKLGDQVIHRIPLVNKVYKAAQDVMHSLFSQDKPSFSQAVFVPFPKQGSYAVGFLVSSNLPDESNLQDTELMSVFVPGTPNPMMGFMLLVKRKDVIFVDLPVDDALKFVVSCGVKFPGCKVVQKG
jgi:uncharacterized membrane protein